MQPEPEQPVRIVEKVRWVEFCPPEAAPTKLDRHPLVQEILASAKKFSPDPQKSYEPKLIYSCVVL